MLLRGGIGVDGLAGKSPTPELANPAIPLAMAEVEESLKVEVAAPCKYGVL